MGNYIGKEPVNGFFTRQSLTTDGSTVTFTLNFTIASTTSILVLAGGVVQEPDVAYTLSGGGTAITFTTAPASNTDTYIHYLGQAIVQTLTDLNGTELILDQDTDTTIHADTDDEIDFKIGGSDVITFKATGIHLPDGEKYVGGTGDDLQLYHDGSNSYLANSTGELRLATLTSGIAIAIGHSTSEVTFGDNVTVTGNLTIGGTTNFGDFNITNVGSIALDTITNDGTDITLDSSGDIILDAAGNDIFFKAGGTTIGEITNSSSDLVIKSSVSDKDILIKGNDGGSAVTALTLDMSAAGAATFNSTVTTTGLVIGSTAVTSTATELNLLDGVAGLVQADLTKLAALDVTATELNLLDDKDATHLAVPGKLEGTSFDNSLLVGHATTGTLTNANRDVGVGIGSLAAITVADDNTALGYNSGGALTSGGSNTIIGNESNLTGNPSGSASLGYQALKVNAGTNNIGIGKQAGKNISSGSGNVIIGAVDAGSATGSRQLKIAGYDGSTTTTWISGDSSGNLTFGGTITVGSATVTEAQLEVLDGATITTTELNLIDGGATIGTTAFADGDGLLHNDGGTMRVTTVQTLAAYLDDEITAMPNLVTTAATTVGVLGSGSIAAGFGNIDNGASNITSGGLVKLDVDVDADDVSADSATGRLTIGASEDLNLYHGGTHSYIVNDTGNLVIDTAGDLTFDAAGNDFKFLANGTEILNITNSSSDVIIKPLVDAKDIIFQQRDGTEVARIEDNATFNVSVAGKFAIAGTAVTSTAAELNLLDGVSGLVQADLTKLAAVDATAVELNYTDGVTSAIQTQMDTKASTGKAIAMAIVFG